MKRSSGPRKIANLSESIGRQLNMYALAASAAGVGVLALAQPAEAKIIYTPAHVTVYENFTLDLNHDGINDFYFAVISHAISGGFVGGLGVARERGGHNEIVGRHNSDEPPYAYALRAGALIGPRGPFTLAFIYATMAGTAHHSTNGTTTFFGLWANGGKGVKNRYLGLKFFIKGKVHFGWARLNYTYNTMHQGSGLLTGYAYETIPGKAILAGNIVAGETTGPEDIVSAVEPPHPAPLATPKPQPATLGLLAMGVPGVSIWRRKEAMGAVQ